MPKPVLKNGMLLKQKLAIELVSLEPHISNKELSKKLHIDYKKICLWRNNPKFINKVYDRFMEIAGNELPKVIMALIREAKEGNTRAAELVLKHFGKLQDTLVVKVEAPFIQHLKSKSGEISTDDAIDLGEGLDQALRDVDYEILPERDPKNDHPLSNTRRDFERTNHVIKHAKKNSNRNKRYGLRRRAEKVGLDPLPPGRPDPAKRRSWISKLKRLEKKQNGPD
jgi:hypothetical protein